MSSRSGLLLLVPALVAGCYTYTPIEPSAVTPGMAVRARLNANTAARLESSLGSDSRLLTGVAIDNSANGMTLEVQAGPYGNVNPQEGLYQRIMLAPTDVLEVEARTFSNQKTTLAVAAGVAVAATAVAMVVHGHSSGSNAPVEPEPNFVKIKLLGIRF